MRKGIEEVLFRALSDFQRQTSFRPVELHISKAMRFRLYERIQSVMPLYVSAPFPTVETFAGMELHTNKRTDTPFFSVTDKCGCHPLKFIDWSPVYDAVEKVLEKY